MYFKDLHNVFSSWELALSAYNAGEYGIIRRIMKHGTRDFYELSRNKQLPTETINYVPKVLAAMYIVNNAEKYGFVIPKKNHRLYDMTELRAIKKNVPLSTVAKRLNIDVIILKKLNPELRRGSTPRHFAGTYYLRVPQSRYSYRFDDVTSSNDVKVAKLAKPESKKELKRRTAKVQDEQIETVIHPKIHRIRRGETLVSVARKYNMTPKQLAFANDFKMHNLD
jgi:membrane-bound lytic murein transglycosylase D